MDGEKAGEAVAIHRFWVGWFAGLRGVRVQLSFLWVVLFC